MLPHVWSNDTGHKALMPGVIWHNLDSSEMRCNTIPSFNTLTRIHAQYDGADASSALPTGVAHGQSPPSAYTVASHGRVDSKTNRFHFTRYSRPSAHSITLVIKISQLRYTVLQLLELRHSVSCRAWIVR